MAVKFCTLFSGSSANSAYIGYTDSANIPHGILIDAGAGIRKTEAALNGIGVTLGNIEAVFVTHEHSDHIAGLKTILKKYDIPVISNRETLAGISDSLGGMYDGLLVPMPCGASAKNGEFTVTSFEGSHDSAHCCGYTVTLQGVKVGYLTDCGKPSEEMLSNLADCNAVIIEANHDPEMLRSGPYPPYLKDRIASDRGHMSNGQCGSVLCRLAKSGVKSAILAHLSKENNTPRLADITVKEILEENGIVPDGDIDIYVAPPSEHSKILEF